MGGIMLISYIVYIKPYIVHYCERSKRDFWII